eukprot:2887779-Amphidinium_carterae.1
MFSTADALTGAAFSTQVMSSEPDPEATLSDLEPLLPVRHYAAGSGHSVALDPAPSSSSSSSTSTATQTVPLPDSVESSLLGGLPPTPIYVVWCIGSVSTLPVGIHT